MRYSYSQRFHSVAINLQVYILYDAPTYGPKMHLHLDLAAQLIG